MVEPMQPLVSNLVPSIALDRYELICVIAEGSITRIWIARQKNKLSFEKLITIKTILPKFASDPSFQSMFLDEVRLTARIQHDNVAQILDVNEQEGTPYLVMEYVDGESVSVLNRTMKS